MFRLCFPDPDNVMDNVMDNAMDNVMESTDEESEEEPIQVHVAVPEDEDPARPVLLPPAVVPLPVEPVAPLVPEPPVPPAPFAGPPPVAPVPFDELFPRRDRFGDAIVRYALPYLVRLLRDPANRLKPPRDLVNNALDICKANGEMFWGMGGVYSRKRSVCDAVLAYYFQDIQGYLSRHAQRRE